MKNINFRLNEVQHQMFKGACDYAGYDMSYVLNVMIHAYVNGHIDIQNRKIVVGIKGLEVVAPSQSSTAYAGLPVSTTLPKRGRPPAPPKVSETAALLESAGLPPDHKFLVK